VYVPARLAAVVCVVLTPAFLPAQEKAPDAPKTQVRINYLNVCTPSEAERQQMEAALKRIPLRARFAADFEISRGRSTLPDAPVSHWVRIRREFPDDSPFSSVQYSVSVDEQSIMETLVFRVRDPKDVLMVSLQDTVAATTDVAAALSVNTPANRVKVERFGQSSLALSRCPAADQSTYEPLFRAASEILARYRASLNVRRTVPGDFARLGVRKKPAPAPQKAAEPSASSPN